MVQQLFIVLCAASVKHSIGPRCVSKDIRLNKVKAPKHPIANATCQEISIADCSKQISK